MRQFTLLQSYEILYDKNLKGCVYKRLQISDLSGLKKMKRLFSYSFYATFQLQFTIWLYVNSVKYNLQLNRR